MVIQNWLSGLFTRGRHFGRRSRKGSPCQRSSGPGRNTVIIEMLEERLVLTPILAANDSFSVQSPMGMPMPTSLDVLANDSGGTGTLLIASVGSIPYGVATIQHAMTQGGHDTLLFTPTTGYSGSESFTYTAADAAGDTATATVSVMISGYGSSAPQITSLSSHSGSTSGGTSLTIGGSGFSQVTAVLFGGRSHR